MPNAIFPTIVLLTNNQEARRVLWGRVRQRNPTAKVTLRMTGIANEVLALLAPDQPQGRRTFLILYANAFEEAGTAKDFVTTARGVNGGKNNVIFFNIGGRHTDDGGDGYMKGSDTDSLVDLIVNLKGGETADQLKQKYPKLFI